MLRILTSTVGFLISYLVLMIPTYLLPYTGSNSSIINGMAALVGRGPTPQWWMHFWCLFMLILISQVRGRMSSKPYLLAFPILALVFDLTPGLSAIPLVPTLLHLLCLILGAMGTAPAANEGYEKPVFTNTARTAAGISILSIAGIVWFAVGVGSHASPLSPPPPSLSSSGAAKSKTTETAAMQAPPTKSSSATDAASPSKSMATPNPAAKPHMTTTPPVQQQTSATKAEKPTVRMINIHE